MKADLGNHRRNILNTCTDNNLFHRDIEILNIIGFVSLRVRLLLQECGHKAAFYHGSMDPSQRAFVQNQWSKDEINIICATVAFGMGTC